MPPSVDLTMSRSVSQVYLREIHESLQIYTCANWPFADPTYQLHCLIFPYRQFFGIHMEDLRQMQIKYTRYAWAGGTFFPVVLLCQFFVLAGNRFWFYILLMSLEYHTLSCGVVLVFLVLVGNCFWCYLRT
jgi:hypothetical protein